MTIFLLTVLPDLFTVVSAIRMGPGHLANLFTRRGGVNLVPFRSIALYLRGAVRTEMVLVNLLGNIVMFSPLGALPPLIWPRWRKWWKLLLLGFAFSCGIEIAQHFVGRNSDIDDLLLNVLGVLLGYAVWRIGHGLRGRKRGKA
ncbi:MAG: VanZ family protein [Oscillospiraceae bacterium]|nr:VanZ family protein [Oscillospiraceae bacterium]MCL1952563.1 VanZ family protein [Oscillospiraceae bacterium]